MGYVFAAAYVALGALYLFLAATDKPGMAAWCVSAALAVSLAGFMLAAHQQRSFERSQRELIESQHRLLSSKDQLIELLVDKAGVRSMFDAAKAEAEAIVGKGGA